jgi:hypothetical protein
MPQTIAFQQTTVPAAKSASEIEALLQKHGASHAAKEFEAGRIKAMAFVMDTPDGKFPFRMPVNVDAVFTILMRERKGYSAQSDRQRLFDQAERVAWRIAREWVKAQLDLIQTQMVTITEVFFPYMLIESGQTAFQVFKEGGLPALMAPREDES